MFTNFLEEQITAINSFLFFFLRWSICKIYSGQELLGEAVHNEVISG